MEPNATSSNSSFYDAFVTWINSSELSNKNLTNFQLDNLQFCIQLLQDKSKILETISQRLIIIQDPKRLLVECINIFQPCFFHPWSTIRQLVLQIMRLFDQYLSYKKSKNNELQTIFSILMDAENIPATLDTYRQKVTILRKLKYGSHLNYFPFGIESKILENVVLKIYLSQLFNNFTLLWPMITELVDSYAYGLPIDQFWDVFGNVLFNVTQKIKQCEVFDEDSLKILSLFESEKQIVPDYFSFRLQLFKLLGGFADIAERRTKILSSVLIDLYRNEFQMLDNSSQRTENLIELNQSAKTSESGIQRLRKYGRKRVSKALQENFENIIDEKKFRDELVRFTVDEQNSIIEEEHRKELMPFLMRLLYGKLQAHVATRGQTKRAAIFRYLPSCRPNELDIFINVLFNSFCGVFDIEKFTSVNEFFNDIVSNYDPSATIPLRKIQSCLNNIADIVKKLAPSLNDEQCFKIFKICMICAILIRLGFEHATKISEHHLKFFKGLRLQIFKSYQQRVFPQEELQSFWSFFIEPSIWQYNKLLERNGEDILPVSFTRLFVSWTHIPMLYHLLNARFGPEINGETPVELVCNTLLHIGTPKATQNLILEGVLNLLIYEDEMHLEKEKFVLPQACLPKILKEINLGTLILVKHSEKILNYLSDHLPKDAKNARKLPDLYLNILSKLSEFVFNKEIAVNFASTLILYVSKCHFKSEEKLSNILTTISRFIVFVDNPEEYLRKIVRLFSSLKGRGPREALTAIVSAISSTEQFSKDVQLKKYLELIVDLESWDVARINEPDIARRHTAFSLFLEILHDDKPISQTILQILVHISIYNLFETEDISIRVSSSNFFRCISNYIASCKTLDENTKRGLLHSHLIDLLLKGLLSQNEMVRHEVIQLMANLIDLFPSDEILCHFSVLRTPNEKDVDFFENATHIQIHRRQRAFFRLTEQLSSKKVDIPSSYLHKFIIPILNPYLTAFTSKTSALSDQAVKLFSEILKITPWPRYYRIFAEYMSKLRNPDTEKVKIYVRILVAIIDSFHTDLRKCELPKNIHQKLRPDKSEAETEVELILSEEQKILQTVINIVLPQLRECIRPNLHSAHRKSHSDEKHFVEDDEMERAPISLATAKLLQKLPDWVLNQHLQGILLTLNRLLLSRSFPTRQGARKIMESVVQALGSKYLPFIIKEMRQLMHKGYQVHVMIYTVQTLISSMENILHSGDLDACLEDIIEVCRMELFSDMSDEKEVGGIKENIPEVKSNKTFDTYVYLGRFLSTGCLANVIEPMRKIIETLPSSKNMKQLSELLRAYSIGLKQNQGVDPHTMLLFVHHNLSRSVFEMLDQQNATRKNDAQQKSNGYRPENCLLLQPEPKRLGMIVKTSVKSRSSIFVEFALQVLAGLLKLGKFVQDDQDDIAQLDPLIPLICDCLLLKYDKIIGTSLRCLTILFKFSLPAIKSKLKFLIERFFVILADYAGLGAAGNKATILELNQLLFKCFSYVISDAQTTVLTSKRIQLLLNYCETDVLDSHKQATAFLLIKSIVGRKIEDPKVENLMDYLAELSIISENAHIRTQCRNIVLLFITIHPQRNIDKSISFFLEQLEYEFEDGRLSALEMLNSIFEENLDKFALSSFIKLSARLTNDESSTCKKYVSMALNKLISLVSDKQKNELFGINNDWLESDKESVKFLGLKVLGEFVKSGYLSEKKLLEIFPLVAAQFEINSLVEFSEDTILAGFEILNLLITTATELFEKLTTKTDFLSIYVNLNHFLECHESSSIQMASSEFVQNVLNNKKVFRQLDTSLGLSRLCTAMCSQLRKSELHDSMAELAIRNLIGIFPYLNKTEYEDISKKLASICKYEIFRHQNEAIRRLNLYKFVGASILKANTENLQILSNVFMPFLHREMNRKSAKNTDELQQLAVEVGELFKDRLGELAYSQKLAECQHEVVSKYESRNRRVKERALLDPAGNALKKQRKQAKKVEARKRKIDELKPYRIAKRRRRIEAKMINE